MSILYRVKASLISGMWFRNIKNMFMALSYMNIHESVDRQWYVDFGETAHVIGDIGRFQTLFPYHGKNL